MKNRERIKTSCFTISKIKIICVLATALLFPFENIFAQSDSPSFTYTVKEGDFLTTIAVKLGSAAFWEPIFAANREIIENPDIIFPGQKLKIPPSVVNSDKFTGNRPEEKKSGESQITTNKTDTSNVSLEKFRKAFSEIVEKKAKKEPTQTASKKSINPGLEFGGLVIDETRSKIGKDFFNLFYQNWESPTESSNFLLTITEQPAPGMGTIIAVNLDNQKIFQSRLQPRRPLIEQQAQRAIAISHRYLQQQIQLSDELNGY